MVGSARNYSEFRHKIFIFENVFRRFPSSINIKNITDKNADQLPPLIPSSSPRKTVKVEVKVNLGGYVELHPD